MTRWLQRSQIPLVVTGCVATLTRLRQMITRLAANAIQCTNEGEVTVCARIAGGETPLLRIDVRDNGGGISAAAQQKMFGSGTPADDSFRRMFGGADPVLMMYRQHVHNHR